MAKAREEVLNVVLAQLLSDRGVISNPEQVERWNGAAKLPDVLVEFQGLRTVIEGKSDTGQAAREKVEEQARLRVEEGVAHIGMAVLYPEELRELDLTELRPALQSANLELAIYTEAGTDGWMATTVDQLGELLRRTFDQLVAENVVAAAVEELERGVEAFARALSATPATVERIAELLGIGELEEARAVDGEVDN